MSFAKWVEEEEKKKKKTVVPSTYAPKNTSSNTYFSDWVKDNEIFPEDDDIAPVKSTVSMSPNAKEEDDGFQIFKKAEKGNVVQQILGTVGDAGLDVVKGVGRLGEGVGDLLVYGAAGVADLFGADDWADGARRRASESVVDKVTKDADDYLEQYSVFGRTTDSVMEGIGQVGGILLTGGLGSAAGLGSAGVSALTTGTMFASGTGSGMGEAYQAGATDLQALKHGLNSGAVDAVSEMIFGGLGKGIKALGISKGLSSADDILAKFASSKLKNQAAKNIVEFGIKSGAEGLEEVIAGIGQAYSKHNTYMSDEDFLDILADEKLLEQFVVGSLTSGVAQGGGLVSSIKSGRDFVTGYSRNEQAVVDKEIENRIAEQEKNGNKLTGKEKSKIADRVREDLERGYISTDTIESVLGGDSYKAYKDALDNETSLVEQEKALTKEYDDLNKKRPLDRTGEEWDRIDELKTLLPELRAKIKTNEESGNTAKLKSKLFSEVDKLTAKDYRLRESYNELVRSTQDFKADFDKFKGTKHEEAARKTIESAIKLGANNTNKVHDIVYLAAHTAAESGKVIEFKNNEDIKNEFIERQTKEIAKYEALENPTADQSETLAKMKELLEKVQSGKTIVNGNKTGDTIVVNIDSDNALNCIVGHEITHGLEKAKSYGKLGKHLFNYAKSKGVDTDALLAEKKLEYEGVAGADPEAELVADLVGDYLFTDYDYVLNLTTSDRNLAQKVYDTIKHLYKMATAGSKEARELERVKYAFENALREAEQNRADAQEAQDEQAIAEEFSDANTNYSIREKAPPTKTIEGYKVFIVKDGNLYPPMVANPEGEGTPVGVWLDADVGGLSYDESGNVQLNNRGRFKVKAGGKGTQGGGGELAFRPGWHLGEYPDASQFGRENAEKLVPNKDGKMVHPKELFPYNFVWAKCEVAADNDYQLDAMSFGVNENGNFERSQAGLPYIPEDGYYKYRTNADPNTAPWIISGSIKVVEILDDEQVAKICAEHGVTPQQRQAYATKTKESWPDTKTIRSELNEAGVEIPKGAKQADLRKLYSETFLNGEIPTQVSGYSAEARPGGKIDLPMFGLNGGQVTPTSEDVLAQIRQTEGTAATRKAETAELLKTLPGYAKRKINFDDANIIKEFGMNNQSVDEYRAKAEETEHGYLADEKIYGGDIAPTQYSFSSISNSFFGEADMTSKAFKKRDYKQTEGYNHYVNQCLDNYKQTKADFAERESEYRKEIEDSIDGIVRVAIAAKEAGYDIFDDATKRNTKDSKNRLLFSSLEPNSDYFTSSDISTICDKRQNFAEIYDDIVRAEEKKGVPKGKRFFDNVDNYFYLHAKMAEKGLTTPCRQCYVESMRKNLAPMASAFLRLVNETNPNNTANDQLYQQSGKNKGTLKSNNAKLREKVLEQLAEYHMSAADLTVETLTTEDGLAQLKIQAPLVYEAFNSFYGQSKPKMPKSATPFRFGELTALLTDEKGRIKQSLVDKINSTGGFRLQSYSDFQIQNYTDVLQVIFEAGTLGLNGHAYTKVPAFLEATKGTNLKRNISIFMYKDGNEWKLDRNDSFPYSLEEIYDLVKSDKTGNTGIIAVSQNDDMSAWIMANDLVGYGIPFHKSGLKMGVVRDTDVKTEDGRIIKGYSGTKDHTKQQTEVWAKTTADHKALTKVKNGINIYGEDVGWDFANEDNLSKNELIEKNVKAYIDACERAGYLPKFRDYVMNNGKVLENTLKYAKELGYASQTATIDDISFQYKGYTIPYGYYKFLGDFGMFTPDGKASPQETLSLKNYDFAEAEQFFADAETLRRNEVLQQFANGEVREDYRSKNLSAEELLGIVKQKRGEVVESVVPKYSLSDSNGNQLSPAVQNRFAKSKVVDENGSLKVVYHGTATGEFTIFDKAKGSVEGDFGSGFYFTDNEYDVERNYEGGGPDFDNKIDRRAEQIEAEEDISYAAARKRAIQELYVGSHKFEVYLNIENPAVVGKTTLLDYESFAEEYDRNDYDSDEDYESDVEYLISDKIDEIIWEVGKNVDVYSTDGLAEVLWNAVNEGGIDIEQLKANINELYLEDSNGNMVGNEVTRQIIESLGYDGIIDPTVSGKWNMEMEEGTTHYIVFKPNQIKNVSNQNPTDNPDINLSLSSKDDDIAPVGGYDFYGKDFRKKPADSIAPIAETAKATAEATTQVVGATEDEAPVNEATKRSEVESVVGNRDGFMSKRATELYEEITRLKKGVRASQRLGYLLDHGYDWRSIKTALLNIRDNPNQVVNPNSAAESTAREMLGREYDAMVEDFANAEGVTEKIFHKMKDLSADLESLKEERDETIANWDHKIAKTQMDLDNSVLPAQTELENLKASWQNAIDGYNRTIANKQAELAGKKNTDTKVAHNLKMQIERLARLRDSTDAEYAKRISQAEQRSKAASLASNKTKARIEKYKRLRDNADARYAESISRLEERLEKMSKPEYKTAMQRKKKQAEYTSLMENLVGDTSTWVDKKLGLSYKVNTLRRNLRDIVKDANGNPDIEKADAIYDELQGKYNHNEAELKRESKRIKDVFQKLNLNSAEDTYAHMLGEFRHNPDTKLTEDDVKDYYNNHKSKIDTAKVDKAIEESRKVFDELIVRVNERLREQGMKEIPYRQGYFPHFTNPKQGLLAKFFNWKPVDNEIPTSIAGLTEEFNPQRSWQSFNKQRKGDTTDYSLEQGLDSYIHGALDWIYHIEDIQKRRALENHIRYTHSEEGVKKRIDEIRNNDTYDADEAQAMIDAVYAEANNPLNNFVTDLRAGTNTLANKKSSMDRKTEEMTNRKIYSVMTNLNNRINANMVVGSFSSALTNFIPITQSWMEVSPVFSLKGMRDTIISTIRDDGIVNKSDFLTNRLMDEEKLYQTGWDKVSDKAAFMMNAIDSFTSQTVWRSKYLQNISEGMSETEAIKNADQFAENVIAGRSRGNQPTIFDAKNPLTKIFTAFQLEVANQYGYMFKDAPQDSKNKARLVKGYATAFLGAYAYNALYSSLVGRDAAFDPISILEDLFKDLFGDDEEEEDALLNLTENVLEEVPFVGGLLGGGRIPLSSAMPYNGDYKTFVTDLTNGELSTKEMLKPIYYLAMPVAGGQIKKTNEGLGMFSDDHPVAGSYTESGNLRFPVEDTFGNRVQAAMFGQYASKNARDYFDKGRSPLKEKQIQEYIDVDIPISDYWKYREGLSKQKTVDDKFDYIAGLDLPVSKKNILINNIVDRKEDVDMTGYEDFSSYDEFDFATKNPGKYAVSQAVGDYSTYSSYYDHINDLTPDKDENGKSINGSRKEKVFSYIDSLPLDYGQKCILFKSEYKADDSMNMDIINYLDSREDIDYDEMVTILTELGFTVDGNNVYWD